MTVGGQAVLEGVMMRSPSSWAVAVRKPDGNIAQVCKPITSPMAKRRIYRLPVVRGVVALGESLAIGFRALTVSANYAVAEAEEGDDEAFELGGWTLFFSFAVAIGFVLAAFKVGPALIADSLPIKNGTWFVLVEGLIRVTLFVGYLALLSLIPSLKRVFQYHAAELERLVVALLGLRDGVVGRDGQRAEADRERLAERDDAADDREPQRPVARRQRGDRAVDLGDLPVGLADGDRPVARSAHHDALQDGLAADRLRHR